MVNKDTLRLLQECDEGVKMGIHAIEHTIGRVKNENLASLMEECKREHEDISSKVRKLLNHMDLPGKEPSLFTKIMSDMTISIDTTNDPSDSTVASLITNGCSMGIQGLSSYVAKYETAEEFSKDIARDLIDVEKRCEQNL